LCYLQPKLIGFYNQDENRLLRGTNWGFKYSSLRFVFKRLNEEHKKPLTRPQISVFDQSTEVSTGIIQTEGDINILFTHISNKNI
jgi:hypothetical protein